MRIVKRAQLGGHLSEQISLDKKFNKQIPTTCLLVCVYTLFIAITPIRPTHSANYDDNSISQDRATPAVLELMQRASIASPFVYVVGGGGGDHDDNNDVEAQQLTADRLEMFLLEDKDYPRSVFEDYSKRVGQISGIATLPSNDVVIFHRAQRQWTQDTRMPLLNSSAELDKQLDRIQEQLIKNDTLMILDAENGNKVDSFGADLFYMPHSVTSDAQGNLWVSDVARHQVMRLPTNARLNRQTKHENKPRLSRLWPDIVLGEAFTPGQDQGHFCQPAEIAVSSNGRLVFIADGYCNQRVAVFTGEGQYLTSFGQEQQMQVVHTLTLLEERNLLCVGDREGARILCYRAGLDGRLASLGRLELQLNYPIGRVFALIGISRDHLLVSSLQFGSNRYDLAILNPFTSELKLVWTSSDLLEPHSLARTFDRQYAYAADMSPDAFKKVFKFDIITRAV